MSTNSIDAGQVRALLFYDAQTGVLVWNMRPVRADRQRTDKTWNRCFAGKAAGTITSCGYVRIKLLGKKYMAHVLAWVWMTGEFPINEIDHKDTIKSNNKWDNLRIASHSQNQANSRAYSNNKSGIKGVYWYPRSSRWIAQIKVSGRTKTLGYFGSSDEARAAYADAAKKHFGEFARAS